MSLSYTPDTPLGTPCPHFELMGTDDRTHSLDSYATSTVLVVMFICNHCPYVKAVEERLIQLAKDFSSYSVSFVAINPNDTTKVPEDSMEHMKDKQYPFAYLADNDQSVAKKFGAVCTPDFFVYNSQRQLAYRGRLDDSWKSPEKVSSHDLRNAVESLLDNQEPAPDQKPSMGCSIKWKSTDLF